MQREKAKPLEGKAAGLSLSGEVNGEVTLDEVEVTMESLISEIAGGRPTAGIQPGECLAQWMRYFCGLIHPKTTIIVA